MALELQQPQDVRGARQIFECYKLKALCKVLKQYDNDENTTSVADLARKVDMKKEEFLAHADKADFFHESFDDGEFYATVKEKLRQAGLAELRNKTIARLKRLKPEYEKKKKVPSLRIISQIGKEVLNDVSNVWFECKCAKSWAHLI